MSWRRRFEFLHGLLKIARELIDLASESLRLRFHGLKDF